MYKANPNAPSQIETGGIFVAPISPNKSETPQPLDAGAMLGDALKTSGGKPTTH